MPYILVGLRQAPAVCVIEAAVVVAANPATLDIAVAEVGAAMSTMPIDEAVFAAQVLVENEILAHEPHRPRPGLLELAGAGDWPPIAAQQITHRGTPTGPGKNIPAAARLWAVMLRHDRSRLLSHPRLYHRWRRNEYRREDRGDHLAGCRLKSYGVHGAFFPRL